MSHMYPPKTNMLNPKMEVDGTCFSFSNGWLSGSLLNFGWVPSLKLTYPLKKDPWKRRFLLETIIFTGYVSFREGTCHVISPYFPHRSAVIWPKNTLRSRGDWVCLEAWHGSGSLWVATWLFLRSQWLTFWTFGDSIFSRENKVQTVFQGPLAKWVLGCVSFLGGSWPTWKLGKLCLN